VTSLVPCAVMTTAIALTRRAFLTDLGRGAVALTIVGIAGCAPSASGSSAAGSSATPQSTGGASSTSAGSPVASSAAPSEPDAAVTWERANLGFVSAYVLVRAGEAAIVDTGVAGSEDAIGEALTRIGLDWAAVGHVILTHMHPDHAGSAAAVLDKAPDAKGYAGAADLPAIVVPRPLIAVAHGDRVFDLRIVATPGHTAGHVAVFDEVGGLLVAGDALGTSSGTLEGSSPTFTADPVAAKASVAKLGALTFETLLVGHGEPILTGASAQVAALAAAG
jgi:glyoxylase-like metal-dependent hydrolase (beta-lactamase superfamily II)